MASLRLSVGKHRNTLVALGFVAAVVIGSLLAGLLLRGGSSHPARISGSLTALGPVDLALESSPGKAISPVCGCYRVKDSKDWRGITFAARSVQISRRDRPDAPVHQESTPYLITAANPAPATWEPGPLFFSAELLTFRSIDSVALRPPFDPAPLANGVDPPGWVLAKRRRLRDQSLIGIHTWRPLQVSMLGPVPIGAWVPSGRSTVRLSSRKGLFADEYLRGELVETQRGWRKAGPLAVPLADFMGPDVVIWTRDQRAQFQTEKAKKFVPGRDGSGVTVTALLIRRPPFATRIAAMNAFMIPASAGGGDGTYLAMVPPNSTYRLRLGGKPLSASAYKEIGQRLKKRGKFVLNRIAGIFPASHPPGAAAYEFDGCRGHLCWVNDPSYTIQRDWRMGFRYPPRPPAEAGFTVFGPLRHLHLERAKGDLSSPGGRMLAPTGLNLHDVELLGPTVAGTLPVPAQEDGYHLDLSASADGTVNGQPLFADSGESTWSTALDAAPFIIGIVSFFFGAVAYVRGRAERQVG